MHFQGTLYRIEPDQFPPQFICAGNSAFCAIPDRYRSVLVCMYGNSPRSPETLTYLLCNRAVKCSESKYWKSNRARVSTGIRKIFSPRGKESFQFHLSGTPRHNIRILCEPEVFQYSLGTSIAKIKSSLLRRC